MRRENFFFQILLLVCIMLGAQDARASCALPFSLTNGQTADATQVMANLTALANCLANTPAGSTNALQFNAGAGALGGVGPLANGQLVIGSSGGAPQAATLTAGSGVSITNGPGSITINATGGSGGYNGPPVSKLTFASTTTTVFGNPAYLSTGTFNVSDGSTFAIKAIIKKNSSSDNSVIDIILAGSGNNTGIQLAIQSDGNFIVATQISGSSSVILAANGHPLSWGYGLPGFPNWAVIEAVVSFGTTYNGASMMPMPYTNFSSSGCNFIGSSFSVAAQVDSGAIGSVWVEQLN